MVSKQILPPASGTTAVIVRFAVRLKNVCACVVAMRIFDWFAPLATLLVKAKLAIWVPAAL